MAGVPFVFGNATTSIPLSNLDADFNTPVTIGNTTVGLGNTVTTLGNVTLNNVTIASGTTNVSANSIVNGTSNVVIASSGGAVNISTNGTQAITVDTSQNVGIGTASPANKVDAYDASAKAAVLAHGYSVVGANANTNNGCIQVGANGSACARIDFDSVTGGTGTTALYNTYAGPLTLGTANTERMRIGSTGNVFVNTTGALTFGGGLFNIKNNSDNALQIEMNSNSSGVSINQNTVGGTYLCYFGYRSGVVGSIQTNGTTTSYNVTSDRRLKENIAPFSNGLETITALKPSQYNYISNKEITYQGFIADELQSVVPQAVTGKVNEVDAEGKPIYQGVDASFLIPHLVSAIQELNAKVDAQAAEIKALKGVK